MYHTYGNHSLSRSVDLLRSVAVSSPQNATLYVLGLRLSVIDPLTCTPVRNRRVSSGGRDDVRTSVGRDVSMTRSSAVAGFADAVVLAAGGSVRTNTFDKVMSPILGRPLVAWTVAAVAAAASVRRVILVARPGQEAAIEGEPWVQAAGALVVSGGERRQESVAAGVDACDAEIVIIHDGARPLTTSALVDAVANAAQKSGVAVPLVPLTESLRRLRKDSIVDWMDRYGLNLAQTPQAIRRELLLDAYEAHDPWGSEGIIDETLLVQMTGATVTPVPGERANIKVTVPADIEIVTALLKSRATSGMDTTVPLAAADLGER
jgi:2-C-methyl-D-erythritol 4-phosphate cytidylyltransferase